MTQALEHHPEELALKIPVRNLWHMFLYAWDKPHLAERFNSTIEAAPSLVILFASLLAKALERRKHRGLPREYVETWGEISAVRGRIDVVRSVVSQSIKRGRIYCYYDTYSIDSPRNRIIKSTLKQLVDSPEVWSSPGAASDVRAGLMHRLADMRQVGTIVIRRDMFRREMVGRNDAEDGLILALCELLYLSSMPTSETGGTKLLRADRNKDTLERIFEMFVWRFLEIHLTQHGWGVEHNKRLYWQIEAQSEGVSEHIPSMELDIRLTAPDSRRVIIVDTKFRNIIATGQYSSRFVSSNIYQIYSYVHSQLRTDRPPSEAVLLYPAIDLHVSEFVQLPDVKLRFETIDLMLPWLEIEASLLSMFL